MPIQTEHSNEGGQNRAEKTLHSVKNTAMSYIEEPFSVPQRTIQLKVL